ncbi:MAG: flagellar brake protein [Roseburia sp.]|nr:flagellar brake protein [Roseburia sp.]
MEQVKILSKFISEGMKVELQATDKRTDEPEENEERIYQSQVYDILSEDTIELLMPIEKQRLILLPIDREFDLHFYGSHGLYQCFARIVDRYKSGNIYLLQAELTSNLRKFQRREFYRFSCALEMCARNLEEQEIEDIEGNKNIVLQPGLPLKRSIIVDISGGGLRFISNQRYEPDSLLYCSYNLLIKGERKQYEVVGKVLATRELENRKGTFEHRVQYYNLDKDVREAIIKYIFEEERRNLNNKN